MPKNHIQIDPMASPSDLQYFYETAAILNFSRASERLGIAQPSLTQAMQRLEHAIGEPLFTRHKRGVTLTPAGKQLVLQTRQLIQTWDDLKAKATASMRELKGKFSIGCHPSVALYALGSFMPELLENRGIEIHLVHDLSRKIAEQVISSVIDIGIVVNPVRHPDLIITKLYDDEVTFWSNNPKQHSGATLSDVTLIYDPNIAQSQVLIKKALAAKLNVVRTIETTNLEVVASLTSSGCGIGILPTRVAELAPKKLTKIRNTPVFKDEVCLIARVESKKVAALQYICKLIKESK